MPTTCEIIFENPIRKFYPGQSVSGTVRLTLTKEKKVRGVYIHIYGKAYAHWIEHCATDHDYYRNNHNYYRSRDHNYHNRTNSGHVVSYSLSEDYLNEKRYFVGSSSDVMHLGPGIHKYNFKVMLPAGLPSTVQNNVGHITYGVNVVLVIPMWMNKEFNEHFTVIRQMDLNVDPSLRMPASRRNQRVFFPLGFFCCFPSRPLHIEASVPVTGYTPGQTMRVTIKIDNVSNENISSTNVELHRKIIFYGRGDHYGIYESKQKIVDEYIAGKEIRGRPIARKVTMYVNLLIPPIPPTDCSSSNVIHVKYYVQITAALEACCRSNPVLDLPITIGTYPLSDDDKSGANSRLVSIL